MLYRFVYSWLTVNFTVIKQWVAIYLLYDIVLKQKIQHDWVYTIHLAVLIYQLMLVRFYMQIYGVSARPLGGSLLRACSKKQGSEALAHN